MITRLHHAMNRSFNGKRAAFMFAFSLLLMFVINVFNFPGTTPHIKEVSNGTGIFDTETYYGAAYVYQVLDNLQPAGRHAYLQMMFIFDTILPLSYSLALAAVLTIVLRRAFPESGLRKLNLLPLLAGLFDYLENASIITMLLKYPVHLEGFAAMAGYFTLAKWIFSWISLLLIVIGFIAWAVKPKSTTSVKNR